MKTMKTLLAVVVALCLMMSLAVPTFATETEGDDFLVLGNPNSETTAATEAVEAETEAAETEAATEAAEAETEAATEAAEDETTDVEIEIPVEGEDDHAGHDHDHEEETVPEESMGAMKIVLVVLEVIASIALIGAVLMQSGKEAGLSGALSGNSDSYMNKGNRSTMDKKLARATKWIALVWVLLTLVLCLV